MTGPLAPPDPQSLARATFRGTGLKAVRQAVDDLLRPAGATGVAEPTIVAQIGPLVDYRDAGRVWMQDFASKQKYALKKYPGPEPVDPRRAFEDGTGRDPAETQADRYASGRARLIVTDVLNHPASHYERVTATGEPYGSAVGHKRGTPYWRLREEPRPPRRRGKGKGRPEAAPPPPPPDEAGAPDDIDALTAQILELDRAPLRQGRLLWRVNAGELYAELDCADFGSYVEVFCNFTRQRAYQLIDLARVVELLDAPTAVDAASAAEGLPDNERQARMLAPLLDRPDDLRRVWRTARQTAERRPDGAPRVTAPHIKDVMRRLGLADAPAPREPREPRRELNWASVLAAIAAGAVDAELGALERAIRSRRAALGAGAYTGGDGQEEAPPAAPGGGPGAAV